MWRISFHFFYSVNFGYDVLTDRIDYFIDFVKSMQNDAPFLLSKNDNIVLSYSLIA
jgi:hypothetical protein